MTRLTDNIWIGDATAKIGNVRAVKIGAILNVAQDLRGISGWPDVEYMQVGLVDGPGNPITAYYTSVLALVTLLKRHDQVMVFCHSGSRSMAVILMYLRASTGMEWDDCLSMLRERVDIDLSDPHPVHKDMFTKIDWKLLASMLGD